MSLLKNIYYRGSSLLPMKLVKGIGRPGILLPYHHTVSSQFLPHIGHLYSYKNETQFIKDLDFLLKHYKPVTAEEVVAAVSNNHALPSPSFLLSFDDGLREVNDIIAPILEKKGVPALFFINPAFIDNKELFYRCKISLLIHDLKKNKDNQAFLNQYAVLLNTQEKTLENIIHLLKRVNQSNAGILDILAEKTGLSFGSFLRTQQPFLTTPQLQNLHSKGFSLGGHSMNHPYYQLLPLKEQIEQTVASCRYINEITGAKECCFSFPHSDKALPQVLFDELKKSGIPLLFGVQNQMEEINNHVLHRFNAERPEVAMDIQLKGLIFLIWFRSLTGKNKVTRN
jgi:peptidoglycan/xylan/chitin deacetylase (PgdA/CDA1 family)